MGTPRAAHSSFNVEASALRWPGLVWRPLAQETLEWRTSVVHRRGDTDPGTRSAIRLILHALRTHDGWQPVPAAARSRGEERALA
jgi:hypothetical protein